MIVWTNLISFGAWLPDSADERADAYWCLGKSTESKPAVEMLSGV